MDVAAQVYVRLDSPVSTSAPKTDNAVVVPVTVLGVALAAVATVGGLLVVDSAVYEYVLAGAADVLQLTITRQSNDTMTGALEIHGVILDRVL